MRNLTRRSRFRVEPSRRNRATALVQALNVRLLCCVVLAGAVVIWLALQSSSELSDTPKSQADFASRPL